MIAEPAHSLEDFAQALVVADVVADQIRSSHIQLNSYQNRFGFCRHFSRLHGSCRPETNFEVSPLADTDALHAKDISYSHRMQFSSVGYLLFQFTETE